MPETPVAPAPVNAPITPGGIDFGLPTEPVEVTPGGGGDDRPRDEHGRFIAKPDVAPEPEVPETAPVVDPPIEAPPVIEPTQGLDLESDVAPVFDHDGKFVGGKFLGKYDTLDDTLIAFKESRRELSRLQIENHELRMKGVPTNAPPYVFDPHSMTEDQLADYVEKQLGPMSTEERIEYEENPTRVVTRRQIKAQEILKKITESTSAWENATREAYTRDREVNGKTMKGIEPALFDLARSSGGEVYADFRRGHVGPAEIQALIGLGLLVKNGKLSGEQVTRTKPPGRAIETRAVVPVRTPVPTAKSEADAKYALMQRAAYGV